MLHIHGGNIVRYPEKESVDIGKGPLVFDDLVDNLPPKELKTAQVQVFRFAEKPGGHDVVELAAEISQNMMFLFPVLRVHHIETLVRLSDKFSNLLGRVLKIVVDNHGIFPRRVVQSAHDRVMFAEIPPQAKVLYVLGGFSEPGANSVAVVPAAVIDEDELEVVIPQFLPGFLHQRADGVSPVIDGDADG
jgi:hypothetical protein